MGKAYLELSMSLDGFITGPNDTHEQPLGERGDRPHEWIWRDSSTIQAKAAATGAIIAGRRTYDLVDGWGGSHPFHGVPLFVLTHRVPASVPQGATPFTFVTDGIESALRQARAAAGDKNIYVLGGAAVAQQYVKARLLDEIQLHVVPVLLGGGVRLFDNLGAGLIEFEPAEVAEALGVVHLRLRAVN